MILAVPTWVDPLHGLRHDIYENIERIGFHRVLSYTTGCGLRLSVDDVNKKTLVHEEPTCLACIVANVTISITWKVTFE